MTFLANPVFWSLEEKEGLPWLSSGSDLVLPLQGHRFDPCQQIMVPQAAWCSQKKNEKEDTIQLGKLGWKRLSL